MTDRITHTQPSNTSLNEQRRTAPISRSTSHGFERDLSSVSAQRQRRLQQADDRALSTNNIDKTDQRRGASDSASSEDTPHTTDNHKDNTLDINHASDRSNYKEQAEQTSAISEDPHNSIDQETGVDHHAEDSSVTPSSHGNDDAATPSDTPEESKQPTTEQVLLANLPSQGYQTTSATTDTLETIPQTINPLSTQNPQQAASTAIDGQSTKSNTVQQNPVPVAQTNTEASSNIDSSNTENSTGQHQGNSSQSGRGQSGNQNHSGVLNLTIDQTNRVADQNPTKVDLDAIGLKNISTVTGLGSGNDSPSLHHENPTQMQSTGPSPANPISTTPAAPGLQFGPDPDSTETNPNVARVARGLRGVINQNGGTVTIRLDPPDLGTVRIQMQMDRGTVSVDFHTAHESIRTLLSHQLGQLRHMLETQGLAVDKLQVQSTQNGTFDFLNDQQSKDTPDDGQSKGQYTQQHDEQESNELNPEQQTAFDQVLNTIA